MKILLIIVLLIIGVTAYSQREDTTLYLKYPTSYGPQYRDIWATRTLRLPDTAHSFPQVGVPGAVATNTAGTTLFTWNGSAWVVISGGGGTTLAADSGFIPYANYAGAGMALTNKLKYDTVKNLLYLGNAVGKYGYRIGFPGSGNTAFGDSALGNNTGTYNVGVGAAALRANTTGTFNTALNFALVTNTTGSFNAGLSAYALASNTTGNGNIGIGYAAGYTNQTGSYNIMIGYNAANGNGVVGATAGDYNTYIGRSAGRKNTGSFNVMLGDSTGYALINGYDNTIIGADAWENPGVPTLDGASKNTFLGKKAGLRNTGSYNTLIGWWVGQTNFNASHAIIIGDSVDYYTSAAYQINIGNRIFSDDISRIGILQKNPTTTLDVNGTGHFSNTLTLAPGTASTAPLNIPPGAYRSVPANGDIENDGNNLRYTANGVSYTLATRQKRITSIATSATPTPNAATDDAFKITALSDAVATIGSPGTGSPMQELIIRITDNGTARTLGWNAVYRASSDLSLPFTTIASKTMYLKFYYNSDAGTWDLVALLNNF